MNTITRNLKAAILFCLFSFVLVQGAKSQPFNANLATRLQHTLDSLQALFPTTKGMSIGVYYPGQGSWRGASGISEAGVTITPNMEFGLASNTKLFTAVAIMKLVESNIVHLEDPLSLWLPAYTNVDPTITIRQLLNHRSGVGDVFTQAQLPVIEANPLKIYTIPEVMAFVGPKTFNPGAAYGYSNTNYILAGMVAESATGMHISSLIRENILTPLQLDSTYFDVKETVLGSIAHPWRNGVDFSGSSRNAINSFGGAAGAMYSTSSEMVQWYNALFNGNVLTPASLAQIRSFQ